MPMELNPAQNPFPFPNHISRKWRKPRVMVLHGNFLATILSGTRESWRKRVPGFWREGLVSASTRSWELSAFFSAVMGPGRCHNWVVEAEVPPWRWCLNLVQILWKFSLTFSHLLFNLSLELKSAGEIWVPAADTSSTQNFGESSLKRLPYLKWLHLKIYIFYLKIKFWFQLRNLNIF